MKPIEVLIATANAGKIREIENALRGLAITWRYLSEFPDIVAVDEVGETYEDNAILKAISYSKQTNICALADDSGLEVDFLAGQPGVRSARYAGKDSSDEQRTEKLLTALIDRPDQDRSARFVCCVAFAGWHFEAGLRRAQPNVLYVCQDTCAGVIGQLPRGKNGFGYDPIFIPSGYTQTFGELPHSVKAMISHRARALAALRAFLNDWTGAGNESPLSEKSFDGDQLA